MTSIDARLAGAGLPPLPRSAWLRIDLDALTDNLATVRALAGPGVPIQPVVKADAYGHGAVPVARALEGAGADGFCVATFDEAVALRLGGIRRPIRVLYPVPPAVAVEAARRAIRIAAGDEALLDALLAALAADAATTATSRPTRTRRRRRLGIELEIETGLGRGGFRADRALAAARRVVASDGARLDGLWTHLQAIEDPVRTRDQLVRFEATARDLAANGIVLPPRHVAASAGLIAEVAAYDGVRPGIAIYGIVPDELDPDDAPASDPVMRASARLRPVMSLHAHPVRVVDLPAGMGISYGPTFTTTRRSRIATLPVGYGDGYCRAYSNRAEVLVRGRRVPLVGNVAMDAVMADVTDVPGEPVGIDDEFVLMGVQDGQRIDARDLARWRTTNTWEVVTTMAARLPRVYDARRGPAGLRTLGQRSWR